jgi:hypothetical protein
MAGKIIADIIEAPAGRISLNVANVTVASINASGVFSSTGNLLITQAGTIGTGAITDGAVTNVKIADVDSSKLTGNVAAARITTALNASGDAPIFACRAWVNFNGTGAVAIRASGNVSSITDNGTGAYTINLTTAMPDANYAISGAAGTSSGDVSNRVISAFPNTSSSVGVAVTRTSDGAAQDVAFCSVEIFR